MKKIMKVSYESPHIVLDIVLLDKIKMWFKSHFKINPNESLWH